MAMQRAWSSLACLECMWRVQVKTMGYWGMTSFLWSFFQWFFQGDGSSSNCGFRQFPSLGLAALAQSWSFDFSLTYVGVGEHSHVSTGGMLPSSISILLICFRNPRRIWERRRCS